MFLPALRNEPKIIDVMLPLKLKPLPLLSARPGDFGARVAGDSLLVPKQVLSALETLAIRNGVELVSYVNAFPSSVAAALGWSADEVARARASLVSTLHGVLPDDILNPSPVPLRGFGALPPGATDKTHPS